MIGVALVITAAVSALASAQQGVLVGLAAPAEVEDPIPGDEVILALLDALLPGERVRETLGGRTFDVYAPTSLQPGVRPGVVVNMHGRGSSAAQQAGFSDMDFVAEERGFLVVYPQGFGQSWNSGTCCSPASSDGVDDVAFIEEVVEFLVATRNADPSRVFATGISNGQFQSYRLACESGVFAAFAGVAGSLVFDECAPSRPFSMLHIHGTEDSTVSYELGRSGFDAARVLNGCDLAQQPISRSFGELTVCDEFACPGSNMTLCTLQETEHIHWPGSLVSQRTGLGANDIDASREMADFFRL